MIRYVKDIFPLRGELLEKFMEEALKEAEKAKQEGEVPVGAIIVKDDKIIARGYNQNQSKNDSTLHSEMICIKKASDKLGTWRLTGTTMYVTLEPCSMCAGAIVLSRIDNLVIGAMDPKTGACGSVLQIANNKKLNHRLNITTGVLEDQCSKLLKDFFRELREEKRGKKL